MTTIVMTVPGSLPNGSIVQTGYGKVTVAGGTVTVDIRAVKDLTKAGFTNATLPSAVDLSPTKNVTLTAPAGFSGEIHFDARKFMVTTPGGTVSVPRNAIPALIEAGFTA